MNCTLCGKPVVLVPSAKERAEKFGESSGFYTSLFAAHADCQVRKRNEDTLALMRQTRNMQ